MLSKDKTKLSIWRRLMTDHRTKYDLPYLLAQASLQKSLSEKRLWLSDLIYWIDFHGESNQSAGKNQSARIRFILQLLDRNLEWKKAVAKLIRSVLIETNGVRLFSKTGLPGSEGFWSELTDRLLGRLLPKPPDETELSELFYEIFSQDEDALWTKTLSSELILSISNLIQFEAEKPEETWENLILGMEEAGVILCAQISALGLNEEIRRRSPKVPVSNSPFVRLNSAYSEFLRNHQNGEEESFQKNLLTCFREIENCRDALRHVLSQLEHFGVSVSIVYLIERLSHALDRLQLILQILCERTSENLHQEVAQLIGELIQDIQMSKGVTSFFKTNVNQLARKIAERTSETGEHYITRSKAEYFAMLRAGAGGGMLTAGTVVLKTMTAMIQFPLFFEALLLSINYSASFVLIQMLGFTLATKQPSMTASAIAGRLLHLSDKAGIKDFVDEVVNLTRTQFVSVLGNVGMVIPVALIFAFAWKGIFGQPFMSQQKAMATLAAHHPFESLTILYACFTGVILWTSSIFAGWIENWIVYRRLPDAIANHPRLTAVLGKERSKDIADWLLKNASGLGGSISLGFMLGCAYPLGKLFGLPIDVRHVTLATGGITLAASSLPLEALLNWDFFLTAFAVLIIGTCNVGVAFALALNVAMRARQIEGKKAQAIYVYLYNRWKNSKLEFFYPKTPPKEASENP